MASQKVYGQLVDVHQRSIYPAEVSFEDGRITGIEKVLSAPDQFICPGFIDAHVHIESSMLVPSQFARLAVKHGTVATVSDPHEIANVLGEDGVQYMLDDAAKVPLKFNFGAPSCVPATKFETAGAEIDSEGVKRLLEKPEIKYLAEMMNWPGVLYSDPEVMAKLQIAKELGKPIDGHAPGLMAEQAMKYIAAGPSTDHEAFTYEEAENKLKHGMKILIREGSAAKNFEALAPLIENYAKDMMFCSDDKHPDDLVLGHINSLVSRSILNGYDLHDVLRMACLNPVEHYKLDVGLLRVGDPADFVILDDLVSFEVLSTFIDGKEVFSSNKVHFESPKASEPNNFNCQAKRPEDFVIESNGKEKIWVIEARDGELITDSNLYEANEAEGKLQSELDSDILKIAVVNRYRDEAPACAFIKNIGLKKGAFASCVAHDSHNIIAVGLDDESICKAVNQVIQTKGGISAYDGAKAHGLALPVAGIMSTADGYEVAEEYQKLDKLVKELGCTLTAPYMTLSFMALLVIPQLKLSDKGLFDGESFQFMDLQV